MAGDQSITDQLVTDPLLQGHMAQGEIQMHVLLILMDQETVGLNVFLLDAPARRLTRNGN